MKPDTPLVDIEFAHDQALSRSFIYKWLAVAMQFPSVETVTELLSQRSRTALPRLAGWAAGREATSLVKAVEGLLPILSTQSLETLRTGHIRLFGHTARGLVCPYETEFGQAGEFQQPRQLGKVSGFYKAFGLTVRTDERERPDHVSCELEFMAFLTLKEAYALEQNDTEMLQETQKAMRLFLRDHLGRFSRAFAYLLCKEDCQQFWGQVGGVLFEFITLECNRMGVAAGPPLMPLRPVEEADVPMGCGEPSP